MSDTEETKWTRERMAKFLDITPRHLNYLAQNGVVPNPQGGEWQAAACVVKYIRHLRDAAGAGGKEDKVRKLKAEADTAEMEAANMKGTLMLKDDGKQIFAEVRVAIRKIIESAKIPEPVKVKICASIAKLKLNEGELES